MAERARVLWVTKGLGRGGAERLVVGLASRLDPTAYSLEVAYALAHKDALVPELDALGVKVHDLGARPAMAWPLRLHRLLRDGRFDLVHTHAPLPATAVRLLLRRGRRPALVHTEHNLWSRYRWPTHWANRLTYGRNDAVIAVSDGVAASVAAARPAVEVVIHGIDETTVRRGPAARQHGRSLLGLPEDALVVGTVGNFTPKKDQSLLLQATERLRARHPRLRVVLVGSGPLEDRLRAEVVARRLGDAVVFAGSRGDVPEVLPAFDAFALTSTHEGLPIALLEAMAAGVPPVASAVGGVPEVVSDGHDGLLVPSGDVAGVTAALDRLLADPELRARLGASAASTAGRYDLAPVVARTQAIYEKLLSS